MNYTVNTVDIEQALVALSGEAQVKAIQDHLLRFKCGGVKPDNYLNMRSFRMTIQRNIENYCPQAVDFNGAVREGKFLRVGHGIYRLAIGHKGKEFPAIEEVPEAENYIEGATKTIAVNSYERSAEARQRCIAHYGLKCHICEFDFERAYGEIGKSFTHIHHIVPLSEIKSSYHVDPIRDLRPVCANCHAIIHRTALALTIEQVQRAWKEKNR